MQLLMQKTGLSEENAQQVVGVAVNHLKDVFHREGDRWCWKTKEGKYMTEADAVKAGYRESKEGKSKAK